MKLSKIYSNYPKKFRAVNFRDGLNVVLGHIRDPKAREKDIHNLGKTLFAQVIDLKNAVLKILTQDACVNVIDFYHRSYNGLLRVSGKINRNTLP